MCIPTISCFLYTESFLSEVEEEKQMGEGQPDWAELPNELWQLIFQRVPLLDLITTGRRVCQRWNQIISDEKVCLLYWDGVAEKLSIVFFVVPSLEKDVFSTQALRSSHHLHGNNNSPPTLNQQGQPGTAKWAAVHPGQQSR